jgi:hypothetical protein
VEGAFGYSRFWFSRPFIPKYILLIWPQYHLAGTWVDIDELYSPMAELAAARSGFRNDGETLFEAVQKTAVDFFGKTCGLACARPDQHLSRFVVGDASVFDTRDQALLRFGSFQHTLRGRAFEIVFGGRKSF